MAFAGDFTPVLAKHSKSFSLVDCISLGVDHMRTKIQPTAEMVEITACRLLLVNLVGPLAKGVAMTPEAFNGIVDEVKKQKARVARDGLKDHEARR